MAISPMLLLQWLPKNEYHETRTIVAEFAKSVRIAHADVQSKASAMQKVAEWFKNNPGDTQYLFIGAHGIKDDTGKCIGLGASGVEDEYATWDELGEWLKAGTLVGGLWLGACKSSDAAYGFTPLISRYHRDLLGSLYGFSEEIYPPAIEKVLRKLMEFVTGSRPPYLDVELTLLRQALPESKIEMFYAANTIQQRNEYVNVDEFEARVGKAFRQHLEDVAKLRTR